jgi:hypothetical protein
MTARTTCYLLAALILALVFGFLIWKLIAGLVACVLAYRAIRRNADRLRRDER